MTIRIGQHADLQALVQFNQAMAMQTENLSLDTEQLTRGVEGLLNHPERGVYLVAEVDGEITGSLMVTYEWSDWRNSLFWWIQSVYVEPVARRNGVFTALYQYVKHMAHHDDTACGLRLYMEQDNMPARAVYMAMGMEKTPYQVFEDLL